jgi:hypothetical protein
MYNGTDPILFIGICLLAAAVLSNKKAARINSTNPKNKNGQSPA